MAKAIFKTSSLNTIMKLSASELKILLAMCDIVKTNYVEMNKKAYDQMTKITGLAEKTIRNTLSKLVKNSAIVKAGSLPWYVVDPAIISVGNEKKCIDFFESAQISEKNFIKLKGEAKKRARGDFEMRKFKSKIESKRNSFENDVIRKEAKKRFSKT